MPLPVSDKRPERQAPFSPAIVNVWVRRIDQWIAYANSIVEE
jgi:hypothetical protein